MNTDRWYYRVFQSAPDLIRALLPGSIAAKNELSLDPADPGDRLYRFAALEIKELSQQANLDPLLNLLTLPVRPESELAASSQQILASRPDLERSKSW